MPNSRNGDVGSSATLDLEFVSRRRKRRVIDKTRKRRIYSLSGGASRRMALRADETDASDPARADETERRLASGGDDRAQGVLMER